MINPVIASRSWPAHGATSDTACEAGTANSDSAFQRGSIVSTTRPSSPMNCSRPPQSARQCGVRFIT